MRRTAGLVAGLVAAAALVAPGPAYAAGKGLTVSASRSGWTEVTIPEPFQVGRVWVVDAVVKGTFGGFYAVHVDDEVTSPTAERGEPAEWFSALMVRRGKQYDRWGSTSHSTFIVDDDDVTVGDFPAGRYRIYAVGDAAFSLRVLMTGSDQRVATRVTKPIASKVIRRAVTATPNQPAEIRAPLPPYRRFGGWIGYDFIGTGGGFYGTQCVALPSGPCATAPYAIFHSNADDKQWYAHGRTIRPGQVEPGSWEAATAVVAEKTIERFTQVAIVFDAS